MKHLYIIVEGETELEFVNRILFPYLRSKGINTHLQGLMITMKGGGHGFNNIEHFKKTIRPILNNDNHPIITTMIDHYGINSEKKLPNFLNCIKERDIEKRILCMEQSLVNAVLEISQGYRWFIPNIIRHETETLLFADPENGFSLEEDSIKNAVIEITNQYSNIEDINSSPETAPSKRLIKVYEAQNKKYVKGADAINIVELTGIEKILEKCPRFRSWVEKIIATQST
jgi:hypothetical protein